jgi:hypothetical protein
MAIHSEGIGGIVFLTLYTINLSILVYGYWTRRIIFKSVYTFLLLHVTLRLGAQGVAVAIGTQDNLNLSLLIAFFVLGAEGYFSLVLCAYRFLIHHHQRVYPISGSWLEGKPHKRRKKDGREGKDPWYKRFKRAMTARDAEGKKDPWVMTIIHWTLIGVSVSGDTTFPPRATTRGPTQSAHPQANTVIIVGGSQASGANYTSDNYWSRFNTAQILRAVGQGIFLYINLMLAVFLYLSFSQDRSPTGTLPRPWPRFFRVEPDHGAVDAQDRPETTRVDPTLRVLIIAWPPLIIRGLFGLLQAIVRPINYSHPDAYTFSDGNLAFTRTFVAMENVFAVLPEWFTCCLLIATMFTHEENRRNRIEMRPRMGSQATAVSAENQEAKV